MTRSVEACLRTLVSICLSSVPVSATVVSGQVTDDGGAGIANVDLDFIDRSTGESIALVNDDTDILGFYAVNVPVGDYDIRFKPVSGARLVGVELRGERVEGGAMTLNQQLDSGWFPSPGESSTRARSRWLTSIWISTISSTAGRSSSLTTTPP